MFPIPSFFDAQHAARLVVHLEAVGLHDVLDARAVQTLPLVAVLGSACFAATLPGTTTPLVVLARKRQELALGLHLALKKWRRLAT